MNPEQPPNSIQSHSDTKSDESNNSTFPKLTWDLSWYKMRNVWPSWYIFLIQRRYQYEQKSSCSWNSGLYNASPNLVMHRTWESRGFYPHFHLAGGVLRLPRHIHLATQHLTASQGTRICKRINKPYMTYDLMWPVVWHVIWLDKWCDIINYVTSDMACKLTCDVICDKSFDMTFNIYWWHAM